MMIGTLAVLDAYYPGGLFTLFATSSAPNAADETHARTMALTTLMMFQLYNAYNCRSSWRSALNGFLENKWLLGAVLLCLFAQLLVLQVPFLQTACRPSIGQSPPVSQPRSSPGRRSSNGCYVHRAVNQTRAIQ
jgi:Ca2+-transporting ATPase